MSAHLARRLRAFARNESGTASIEAVLWFPLFFFMLMFAVQVTLISTAQAQVMRIVQDANRAFALGRLADAKAAQDYILNAIKTISPKATVQSTLNSTNKVITSTVKMPFADLSPIQVMPNTSLLSVTVSAQQIREY